MSHPAVTAGVRGKRGRLEPLVLTALYDTPAAVDAALRDLNAAGVPRDLIEVVVSRDAANRFYPGLAQAPGRETFRYAGLGALIGLIVAAALSLAIVAWPGWERPRTTAIVQLLGPNFGVIAGAALGALFGALRRRRPNRRHARAAADTSAILVVVRTRSQDQVAVVRRLLVESGGRDVTVED
jgi:hypothetical protein